MTRAKARLLVAMVMTSAALGGGGMALGGAASVSGHGARTHDVILSPSTSKTLVINSGDPGTGYGMPPPVTFERNAEIRFVIGGADPTITISGCGDVHFSTKATAEDLRAVIVLMVQEAVHGNGLNLSPRDRSCAPAYPMFVLPTTGSGTVP